MKSATNRLIATIIGTILIPIVLYAVYELSSVKEGEKVIERIYRDQLDAIIFSVNQFSNDNISALLNKIQEELTDSLELDNSATYLSYSQFKVLMFKDLSSNHRNSLVLDPSYNKDVNWMDVQDSLISSNQDLMEQLVRYRRGGYRKIEPREILNIAFDDLQVIHAVLEVDGQMVFFTGLLSIGNFAENVLAPKMQQIAQDELIITMKKKESEGYIYLSGSLTKEVMLSKTMWLFPTLEVGISSKNKTVKELVDERTQYNLIAVTVLILLLIFGFALVVRNLRKEIILAQTKSDFVSNVSHELRTPLSLISMFAETLMLDRIPSQEKRKEYEEIIFKETNRLTNIVNKILNFSQMEANKRTYHPQPMDMNQLLGELIHDYAFHLERNGFEHQEHYEPDLPTINADRDALYEALVNLLDNAMKYSSEEKRIILRTGTKNNGVFISVEDAGIGIASDKIKQIFDKFYRVSEGNIHTTKGAGLGLALIHHIVEAHGGDIEVESSLGKGSIFRLIFYAKKNVENTHR